MKTFEKSLFLYILLANCCLSVIFAETPFRKGQTTHAAVKKERCVWHNHYLMFTRYLHKQQLFIMYAEPDFCLQNDSNWSLRAAQKMSETHSGWNHLWWFCWSELMIWGLCILVQLLLSPPETHISSWLGGVGVGGGFYRKWFQSLCQQHRKCPSSNTGPFPASPSAGVSAFLQEASGENAPAFLPLWNSHNVSEVTGEWTGSYIALFYSTWALKVQIMSQHVLLHLRVF